MVIAGALLLAFVAYGVIYMAWRVWKGSFWVGEDEPLTLFDRNRRPVSFWSFVAFWYVGMALMGWGAWGYITGGLP